MNLKYAVLAIACVMYALVFVFQSRKILWTSLSAAVILILAVFFPDRIFPLPEDVLAKVGELAPRSYPFVHAILELVDWNVMMIYLGSMIIASLFIYSRVPARLADELVRICPNTGIAIVAILAMTGIISIFVENVATVLVMAPIALVLAKKLEIKPVFFMIGLAVMSNLEGTATLVGDPPSMIFATFAGFSFNDFFFHFGRPSIFFFIQSGMVSGCIYFYVIHCRKAKDKVEIQKEDVVSWVPFVLLILMIEGLATISFIHVNFEYASGLFVFGMGILGLLWYKWFQKKSMEDVKKMVRELDWETIIFLMGIFVVVGAICETGLLDDFAKLLHSAVGGSRAAGFFVILGVSVAISGFVDNVPYIIVMLPVADSMAQAIDVNPELFMFALLVGSCLGGNLSPYGASANIVSMNILKNEGYPITFKDWLKTGVPFTFVTTAVAAGFLWLVWAK